MRLWRDGNASTVLVGMQTGAATVENCMEFLRKFQMELPLTQQLYCWDYTLRILKHQSERIYAPVCSQPHYLQ